MYKFETDEQKKEAQDILKQGMETPFWKLIVQILENGKKDIQREQDNADMSALSPEEYKTKNEVFNIGKKHIDNLINTPNNFASWLEKPQSEDKDFDPYEKPEKP